MQKKISKYTTVSLNGYLSMDFTTIEEEGLQFYRAAVQHLGLFILWELFVERDIGDINDIWILLRGGLALRIGSIVDNIQLLQHSAEDAKRDAKQWAAMSAEAEVILNSTDESMPNASASRVFQADIIIQIERLIDILQVARADY